MGFLTGDVGNDVESREDPEKKSLSSRLVDDFKEKLNGHSTIMYKDNSSAILQKILGQGDEFTYCTLQLVKQGFIVSMIDERGYHYFTKMNLYGEIK